MAVTVETIITVQCEGPKCSDSIRWVEQKPEEAPDAAWRLLVVQLFDGTKHIFCSKACLLDWLRNYMPSKSPRELAEVAREKALLEQAVSDAGVQAQVLVPGPATEKPKVIAIDTKEPPPEVA